MQVKLKLAKMAKSSYKRNLSSKRVRSDKGQTALIKKPTDAI